MLCALVVKFSLPLVGSIAAVAPSLQQCCQWLFGAKFLKCFAQMWMMVTLLASSSVCWSWRTSLSPSTILTDSTFPTDAVFFMGFHRCDKKFVIIDFNRLNWLINRQISSTIEYYRLIDYIFDDRFLSIRYVLQCSLRKYLNTCTCTLNIMAGLEAF